jgi:hypothetical protein
MLLALSTSTPSLLFLASLDVEDKHMDTAHTSWQQRVADKLKPKEVDPAAKGWGPNWQRFKNVALAGISTEIHEVGAGREGRGKAGAPLKTHARAGEVSGRCRRVCF